MSNHDHIKPSYDALSALRKHVDALIYLADLTPDEDEHHAILRMISDQLDGDVSAVYREVSRLWEPENTPKLKTVKG